MSMKNIILTSEFNNNVTSKHLVKYVKDYVPIKMLTETKLRNQDSNVYMRNIARRSQSLIQK